MRFAICKVTILAVVIMVTGCGNLYEPSGFSFVTQNGVPTDTVISSNVVTIKGNQFPAPITISNGEYSIDGGAFTAGQSSDTLKPGQTLQLQQTSASTNSTSNVTTVTVGGFTTTFTTVTGETGGTVTATDGTNTVTISKITASLSAANNVVSFSATATTNFTSTNTSTGTGSTIPVTFTLQAISNTGAVVYQATTPTSGTGLVTISFGQLQSQLLTGTLPTTVSGNTTGYLPTTTTYWNKTISYWQIVPTSFKIVQ